MKKFSIALILACFIFSANAQNVTMESVCKQLSQHTHTTGNFEQIKVIKKMKNRKIKSYGTFIFSTEGIYWNTKKPVASTMIINSSAMTQISKGKETVTSIEGNDTFKNFKNSVDAFFANDLSNLKKNFKIDFKFAGGKWTITLIPAGKKMSSKIKDIVMTGTSDGTTSEISSVVISEVSGDSLTYNLSNLKYLKELSPDEKKLFISK